MYVRAMKVNSVFCKIVRNVIPNDRGKGMFGGDILMYGFRESLLIMDKYKVLNDNIIRNFFLEEEKKEEMRSYFARIQKTYMSLLKFMHICRFKILNKYDYDYDLFFNKLEDYPSKSKITIIEQNKSYVFKLTDLLHLTCIALTHSDSLFSIPMQPKNPFTNLPFMYHNLVNIYIACQRNMIQIPKLCSYFYESNFDVVCLKLYYEPFLREYTIKRYYDDMTKQEKYDDILDILDRYKEIIPLHIHDNFPKDLMLERFDCVVLINLKARYSLIPCVQITNSNSLESKLKILYQGNTLFGRMYFDTERSLFTHSDTTRFSFNVNNVDFDVIPENNGISRNTLVINERRPFRFGEVAESTNIINNEIHNTNTDNIEENVLADNGVEDMDIDTDNIRDREVVSGLTIDQMNQIRIREMLAGDDWGDDEYEEYTD